MRKLICLSLLLLLAVNSNKSINNTFTLKIKKEAKKEKSDWTYKDTYLFLKENGCKFPLESTAQTIGESGWLYSSNLAKNGNNIIGMMLPKKRKTTAIGKYLNHAKYNSKEDCLRDLILWQEYTKADNNYLEHLLHSRYCLDSNYIKNYLPSIIERLKNNL